MAGCGNCYFGRTTFVGTRGNPKAELVIVGESPGPQEIIKGEPFVGPSWKVLADNLPPAFSESDDHYYVTNAMQCVPIKGKDLGETKARTAEGCRRCRERLLEEIRAHPRKLIIALGNGALWSLTDDYSHKITQERGKVFPSPLAEYGILASVHPAYLLRGGGSYKQFREDIEYGLKILATGTTAKWTPPKWHVIDTPELAKLALEYLVKQAEKLNDWGLAADAETTGFEFLTKRLLCLGVCIDPGEVFVFAEELMTQGDLAPLFAEKRFKWIWQNGKFDLKFMRHIGLPAVVHDDTMLMSYCINEVRGIHDLDQIASDHLKAPKHKDMLEQYLPYKGASYEYVPRDVLYKYAAYDISKTKSIAMKLRPEIDSDDANRMLYYKILIPASEMLCDVETTGALVDKDQWKLNMDQIGDDLLIHENILNEIAFPFTGVPINPRSPKQVGALLYDHLKLAKVNKGTGKEILEDLPQHPAVKALLAHRKEAKQFGTYVKNLFPHLKGKKEQPGHVFADGRVHQTYLIHGTRTGRLSCKDPNMQNQPRVPRIRNQYKASPGMIFIEIDLNQAELRSLAERSGDKKMLQIYLDGISIHKAVSIDFYGDAWKNAYALNDPNQQAFLDAYEQYMRIKALNFGIVYGREANSIAMEFDMENSAAQALINGWAENFPDAWEYIQMCRRAPVLNRTLRTPFGRRMRPGVVGRENIKDVQNQAANFPHQSIASDITLYTAIKVNKTLRSWGVYIWNLVHDAILMEVPDNIEMITRVEEYVMREMESTPTEWGITKVPFLAESKRGYRWGELKEAN